MILDYFILNPQVFNYDPEFSVLKNKQPFNEYFAYCDCLCGFEVLKIIVHKILWIWMGDIVQYCTARKIRTD